MPNDRQQSLHDLCDGYYRAKACLAYLVKDEEATVKELAALVAFMESDECIPSDGVAVYGAAFGHGGGGYSNPVDRAHVRYLRNVAEVRTEVHDAERRLRAIRYDIGCQMRIVAAMEGAMIRLTPVQCRIIELRFRYVGGKHPTYTAQQIGDDEKVQLSDRHVRRHLAELRTKLPMLYNESCSILGYG